MEPLKRIKAARPHGTTEKELEVLEKSNAFVELQKLIKKMGAKGGVLVLQSKAGSKVVQSGLTPKQIRESLCLAIYYAESINLDIVNHG